MRNGRKNVVCGCYWVLSVLRLRYCVRPRVRICGSRILFSVFGSRTDGEVTFRAVSAAELGLIQCIGEKDKQKKTAGICEISESEAG